jgi:hypothetical protein
MTSLGSVFSAIAIFEAANWHGQLALLIAQLPSIIVALTPYPKEQGFAKQLLQFLNVFSFLAHSDSPGTLKPPGVQSSPPAVVGVPILQPGAKSGSATTEVVAGIAALSALAGLWVACAHLTPLETNLINCAEQSISASATNLAPQVEGILSGGGVNWAQALNALEVSAGPGVICAVEQLVGAVDGRQAAGAIAPADQLVLVRSQAWLATQNVQVTGVASAKSP